MDSYRELQRICEKQAALTACPAIKRILRDMAEEYRRMFKRSWQFHIRNSSDL